MTIHGNEVLGPEELVELCAIFDDTWAAVGRCANSEWASLERTRLASILLGLFGLRQLGRDQAKQTALRIFGQGSTGSMGDASTSDEITQVPNGPPEPADSTTGVASPFPHV